MTDDREAENRFEAAGEQPQADGGRREPPIEDVELVSRSLEFAIDISKWDRLAGVWYDRLAQTGFTQDALEQSTTLEKHFAAVRDIIDSLNSPVSEDPVNHFVQTATGAAMVINRDMQVVALNEAGRHTFSVEQGQFTDLRWLDVASLNDVRKYIQSANATNRSFLAVRLRLPDSRNGLAEVCTLLQSRDKEGFVAIRTLEMVWDHGNSKFLEEGFGLTDAEIDICRLLFHGHSVEEISKLRQAALRTVRTQLSTVFQKTDTSGQVELVLLLARLANRTYALPPMLQRHWSDPLGREVILRRADGRKLAHTWMGDPKGKPALYVHGGTHGYLFAPVFENTLRDRGIKLHILSRPGFGNSERNEDLTCEDDLIRSVNHLFAAARLPRMPAIAVHYSSIPITRLAASAENPFSSVVAVGDIMRYGSLNPRGATNQARVFNWLARHAPWANETNYKAAYRQLEHRKTSDIIRALYTKYVFDLQTLDRQNLYALLHNAIIFITANGYKTELEDESMRIEDILGSVARLTVPFHLIMGEMEPTELPPRKNDFYDAEIAELLASGRFASVRKVPDAAFFVFYQQPEFMAQSIADIIEAS